MKSKTISVFSNKGGVGKTFISVNVSVALALTGQKVLLVDMDFQAGQDMARMLNVAPRHAMVDVLGELEKPGQENVIKKYVTTHTSGLDFIPAVAHTKQVGHITPDNIKPFLKAAAAFYDYVVIDVGKAFSETLITVFDHSNLIMLVATPDILAVYQTRWSLDVLQSLHFPLKMVKMILNRSESRGGVAWQEVRMALPCEIFAHVPSDGKVVGMALNRGVPCVMDSPRSAVAEAFKKIAAELSKEDLFVQGTEIAKLRTTADLPKPAGFWDKFGLTEKIIQGQDFMAQVDEDDDIIKLKKKIHERLIEKLNLQQISVESLSDPRRAPALRATTEKIIGDLLTQEAGAIISSHEERTRLVKEIADEALGLGALEDLLADADVNDIMVNSKDEIYIEKNGKMILTNKKFISNEQVRAIIERIIAPLGRRIDESVPMVDARLPDGSRINAIIPPLALNGPMVTIRKFGQERYTIEDLLKRFDSMSQSMADFLNACVVGRKNIIVSGGTGAGKTTLLNVISSFIPEGERIITIEDAAELKLKQRHWGRLESRPSNVEGKGEITIRDLFINTLRMRPDRIIIGECRGPEILDMLQAMNTGHDGSLTTLHANSTRDVLIRMSAMMLLSGIELPLRAMYEMIATAIDIVVHIARFSDGTRKITGITEVVGMLDATQLDLKDVFLFEQTGMSEDGKVLGHYRPTGYTPACYNELVMRGIPLKKEIFLIHT
ncbi:MAG: ATPase, T2SS/T4P/T4SS family [Candidatus Omnitrophota bacterium]